MAYEEGVWWVSIVPLQHARCTDKYLSNSFLAKKVSQKQPKPRQDPLVFVSKARELHKESESKGADGTEVISEHEMWQM